MWTLLLALGLAGPLGTEARPALAESPPSALVEQYAEANWIRIRGLRGIWYTVQVRQGADSMPAAHLIALVGVGKCRGQRTGQGKVIVCTSVARAHRLAPGDFRMDPLMAGASVRFRARGHENHVTWTGDGLVPAAGYSAEAEPNPAAGALLVRWAKAEGRVLGRRTGRLRDVLSWMQEGGTAIGPAPEPGTRTIVRRTFVL